MSFASTRPMIHVNSAFGQARCIARTTASAWQVSPMAESLRMQTRRGGDCRMAGMKLERIATAGGAILYDPSKVSNAAPSLFDREAWRERGALTELSGGRGSIAFIDDGARHWALRRCLRGGLPARLSRDRYAYLGESRVRSFHEARLLARLIELGLPVPAPVAAIYRRSVVTYTAELITEQLPTRTSLADRALAGTLSSEGWAAVGRCLRRFHDAGVAHADLNARNIMLDERDAVWVLDFDGGRLRARGAWDRSELARLERSLAKICGREPDAAWRAGFAALLAAHERGQGG